MKISYTYILFSLFLAFLPGCELIHDDLPETRTDGEPVYIRLQISTGGEMSATRSKPTGDSLTLFMMNVINETEIFETSRTISAPEKAADGSYTVTFELKGVTGIKHFYLGANLKEEHQKAFETRDRIFDAGQGQDGHNIVGGLMTVDHENNGEGSDIAMDTAMVTILASDLMKIPQAIRLSHLVIKTVHQNLFWAFIYNIIAIPIAAGALYPINGFLLNPMIGGAAMAFSSVSVVTNSLRLRRKRISDGRKAGPENCCGASCDINGSDNIINDKNIMKQEFKVEGMMCNHCRTHVENALNSIEGVRAKVTLDPPVAAVESEREISKEELQKAITEKAGEYTLL